MNIPAMVTMLSSTRIKSPREHAKALYAGKQFYIKNLDGTLDGPREDIYYTAQESLLKRIKYFITREPRYKFLQVTDGTVIRAFYADEIEVVQNGK